MTMTLVASIGKQPFVEVAFQFFELAVSLCPESCFQQLLEEGCSGRKALELELEKEIISHPELDLEVEPRFLMKSISRNQLYDQSALELKIKLVIVSKTVIAYLDLFDGDFAEAFFKFRWTLQFLHESRRIPSVFNLPIAVSLDYERSLSLLCAKSLIKGFGGLQASKAKIASEFKVDRLDIFEGLLANILDCTEPSILTCGDELDQFMMDEMFTVLGQIEKCIAFLKGPLCEVEDFGISKSYAIRPQRSHIDGMIRKFILASTFKLSGDPTYVRCFDKILEGIILYGGIHLCIIAFFLELKRFHQAEFVLSRSTQQPARIVKSSYAALAEELTEDWDKMEAFNAGSKYLQCPQVLMKASGNGLIMVNTLYEESDKEHNHEITLLLSAAKLKAKRKIYGKPQTHQQFSKAQWQKGVSWVRFWENCYLDNKGDMPCELGKLLHDIYDPSFSSQ
ncbi:LAME_0D08988g1_1 [Lachancea meyersii CBS 8951]|uniref:LAME_0D08988g1_1 n=1 Tax=Lachancea meyersii CBS 8951 TaxID=1266667 RepID=A0A1G4JAU0_9SACH|nr:LAME_0D08988g1_1 [Lachancea meyersii CBS 8951]